MGNKPRLFLDTSALFAGIWSERGGARMILKLGEAEAIVILVSPQVLAEIEDVLRRKAAEHIAELALLLDRCQVEVVQSAPSDVVNKCAELTDHPGDARVLADAWTSKGDYFVTLDASHFLDNSNLRESIPFLMGTPGDFLAWFRGLFMT